jgi:hypothetical protein
MHAVKQLVENSMLIKRKKLNNSLQAIPAFPSTRGGVTLNPPHAHTNAHTAIMTALQLEHARGRGV